MAIDCRPSAVRHGVGVQLSSWINSLYQFVSQVLAPSVENACSHFAMTGKPLGFSACSQAAACEPLGFTVHVKRTTTGLPLKVSGPSNIPTLPSNLPTTGG